MKSVAVVPGKREVTLVEQAPPQITASTEVEVRILDVGVCGTDRELCAFHYGTPPPGAEHLVIGHESLGQVASVGSGVARVRPGDLVVTMVRRPCPHAHCAPCRAGRQDFCSTGDFRERGIKGLHGFMTGTIVDDERYLVVVPAALRDVAVLVEPLTIAEKALMQVDQVQRRLPWDWSQTGRRAVVLGAGPVGLLGAMALVLRGFATTVYSRDAAPAPKAALLRAIGATYVSAESTSVEELAAQVGNIDVVYEAAGAPTAAFDLMRVLGINGVFVLTGVPGRKTPVDIDAHALMRNLVLGNQVVFGTINAGRDAFDAAIRDLGRFVERWPAAVRSLITGRHPIEAYRDLLLEPPTGIKNVITMRPETSSRGGTEGES